MAPMWLPWNHAAVLALLAATVGWRARGWLRATAHELALVLGLYSLWRLAGALADRHADGALENARALFRFQQWLQLPNELTVQQQVLDNPLVIQALNGYYAIAHVPGIALVLVWLFFRHRDRYSWVRNALALVTAACLLLHFIPLAPPRLLPELGFVDTAARYEQSVYGSVGADGLSNQVAAIPSVHMAWALLVAWGAVAATRSRWRWLTVAHPALTLWAIVATGNHWWLDAVSAAALLAVVVLVVTRAEAWWVAQRVRATRPAMVASIDGSSAAGSGWAKR
jgi:hypothetical protein